MGKLLFVAFIFLWCGCGLWNLTESKYSFIGGFIFLFTVPFIPLVAKVCGL